MWRPSISRREKLLTDESMMISLSCVNTNYDKNLTRGEQRIDSPKEINDMASEKNFQPGRFRRVAAFVSGTAILAASAWAVIHAGKQDGPHAVLTAALGLGLLVGAANIGRARGRTGLLIVAFILICEAFNVWTVAERVVAEREAAQAIVRTAAGAHRQAADELVAAQKAYDDATRAQIADASKAGCKDRCVTMLADAVKTAGHDLELARRVFRANPKPTASESPLADRLGVAPWIVDLISASLLAIGANGLAATLIAFSTAGNSGDRTISTISKRKLNAQNEPQAMEIVETQQSSRKSIADAGKVSHPVLAALENAGHSLSNRQLAAAMGVSEGEASKSWREVRHLIKVNKAGRELRISLGDTVH